MFLGTTAFLDTGTYKQLKLAKQLNYSNFVQILCSFLRCTDKPLDVFFLLLVVILSELCENPRRKIELQGYHFICCTPSFLCHFLSLFSFCLVLRRKKKFAPENCGRAGAPLLPNGNGSIYVHVDLSLLKDFEQEDNLSINNKNDSLNKLIIVKISRKD